MIAVGLMLLGEREEFVAVSHDPIVSIGILRQDLSEIRSVMLLVAVNDRFRIPLSMPASLVPHGREHVLVAA